jgi:hypothetical protein
MTACGLGREDGDIGIDEFLETKYVANGYTGGATEPPPT